MMQEQREQFEGEMTEMQREMNMDESKLFQAAAMAFRTSHLNFVESMAA